MCHSLLFDHLCEMSEKPKIKMLYAVQATGNGHLSRSMEFYPVFSKYADVDILVSGIQGDLRLPYEPTYKRHGLSYVFGKKGGVDYWKTLKSLRPLTLIRDIIALDLSPYDLVVSDFEPISAWKSKFKGKKCVALSHQAAFLSSKSPRPQKKSLFAEFLFRYFSPCTDKRGLHFKAYDDFILTPVVRSEIRGIQTTYRDNHVLVYLPSYSEELLIRYLKQIEHVSWKVFSKHTQVTSHEDNVDIYPVGTRHWNEALKVCGSAIIGSGFEGSSEMLFLKKKIMSIPMSNQYEQLCNAESLKELGVRIVYEIDDRFENEVRDWLLKDEPVVVDYPYVTEKIVKEILKVD